MDLNSWPDMGHEVSHHNGAAWLDGQQVCHGLRYQSVFGYASVHCTP